MLRDNSQMIESARANTEGLMAGIRSDGRRAAFGLYIDCAGRTARAANMLTEEAAEVQAVFKQLDVPLLGFYSGVEIAPFLDKSRGLDWTGVLMVLTEEEGENG